ncbi:hypothetical protein HYW46_00165 [Candidatus Daviesbacteria bacterium]|nr:hypothetical protein [Candidatus Daviesbacteria bacterium]
MEKFPKIRLSLPLIDNWVLEFLALVGIVKFEKDIVRSLFYNRSLIFWDEAKKRGLDLSAIQLLGKPTHEFRLIYRGKKHYFEGTPLNIFSGQESLDDKSKTKEILLKKGIPTALGKKFTSIKQAEKFAKNLGFPLVVKPNMGSLSHHLSTNINSMQALKEAISVAKSYRPDFIVEKFVAGNLYRITVVGKKYIFVCRKNLANVIGDGFSTVKELIFEKNSDPKRGEQGALNTTLHKIPINSATLLKLKSQGLTFKSIPAKNQQVYLQEKFILSTGCDVIDCSAKTHPGNKRLFIELAGFFKTQLIGIDFICEDISKSYKRQSCAVLETNSLPYLDMHQFPSSGKKFDIAKTGWDVVLGKLSTSAHFKTRCHCEKRAQRVT